MKIEIDGKKIRVKGDRGVDLLIWASAEKEYESFSMSLAYDGFEHGCLPRLEISGDKTIKVINNLETGIYLLNGRKP